MGGDTHRKASVRISWQEYDYQLLLKYAKRLNFET